MLLKFIGSGYRNDSVSFSLENQLNSYAFILELYFMMDNPHFPVYFKFVCKDYYGIEHHYGFYIYTSKSENKYNFFLFLSRL